MSPSEMQGPTGHDVRELLNRHGYPFQHTVARLLRERSQAAGFYGWYLEDVDVPVSSNDRDTSIDIVLATMQRDAFMTMECKRVNPAFGYWLFARARQPMPDAPDASSAILESFRTEPIRNAMPVSWGSPPHLADLALELKTSTKGDPCGKAKDLDSATTQALSGLAGMLHALRRFQGLLRGKASCFVVPAIVTTASLWWTDADFSRADQRSGELEDVGDPVRVPWVALHCPVGDGLRHTISDSGRASSVRELVRRQYLRTVFVTSVDGLEEFMRWASVLRPTIDIPADL